MASGASCTNPHPISALASPLNRFLQLRSFRTTSSPWATVSLRLELGLECSSLSWPSCSLVPPSPFVAKGASEGFGERGGSRPLEQLLSPRMPLGQRPNVPPPHSTRTTGPWCQTSCRMAELCPLPAAGPCFGGRGHAESISPAILRNFRTSSEPARRTPRAHCRTVSCADRSASQYKRLWRERRLGPMGRQKTRSPRHRQERYFITKLCQ